MSPELALAHHPIHYLDLNPASSSPVLLLHGLGATGDSWVLQIPSLVQAGFRVLAPDTRGFGKSGYPGKTSVRAMVEDFIHLLDALQVTRASVVGISMGGAQALQMAADFPERVDRLVLVNTFASLRPRSLKVWAYFVLRFLMVHTAGLHTQANFVAQRIFPEPGQAALRQELISQVMQASPAGYRATMRALGTFDLTRRLGEIRAPTLVITGDQDTTVPPQVQLLLARSIPNARQVIIPGAGHAVTIDQPEAFNRLLLGSLSDRN